MLGHHTLGLLDDHPAVQRSLEHPTGRAFEITVSAKGVPRWQHILGVLGEPT
jgi:hypothetical protein